MSHTTTKPGAGHLRWSVLWQSPPVAKLPSGEPDQSQWVNVSTTRCQVVPMPGDKAQAGEGQQKQTAWYEVTIRKNTAILPSFRGTLSGTPYAGLTVYVDSIAHTLTHSIAKCVVKGNT